MNLAVNARDAMPSGGDLTMKTHNVSLPLAEADHRSIAQAGPFVLLCVEDTGCGMTAETRDMIFEPCSTTRPIGKGTGLGLALVHGIVTQHGGHTVVESKVGVGTTRRGSVGSRGCSRP